MVQIIKSLPERVEYCKQTISPTLLRFWPSLQTNMGSENFHQTVQIMSLNYLTGIRKIIFTENTVPLLRVSQMSTGLLAIHLFLFGKSIVRMSLYLKQLKIVARRRVSFYRGLRMVLWCSVTMFTKLQIVAYAGTYNRNLCMLRREYVVGIGTFDYAFYG